MSSNRRLVSRQRRNEESSPASRPRQRESEAVPRQPTALPPYEPPTCPLTETAKRQLDDLRVNQDHTKYKKHMNSAIKSITNCAMETNERLHARKDRLQKLAEKRLHQGTDDDQKLEEYTEAERYAEHLEKKVSVITTQAEKALRDLIDFGDELTMQDTIMKEVHGNIEAPPAGREQNRQRVEGEDEDSEDLAPDADILSAVELFKQAKESYAAEYASKTMRLRYDVNDYKTFKRAVHHALHPGENAPPVPHPNTWFKEASSSRRLNNSTDNTNNADESSDDEVIIQSATTTLKCPLTLKYFNEPYSNHVCNHSFEKEAILDYHRINGVAFIPSSQRGQPAPRSEKQVKCPQTGCEKMLSLKDFYDDALLARQVKRALKRDAQQDDDDDDGDNDHVPRGTQRNRPEQIDDEDDDGVDIEEEEERSQMRARIKREKQHSRGLSGAPRAGATSSTSADDDVEVMDQD